MKKTDAANNFLICPADPGIARGLPNCPPAIAVCGQYGPLRSGKHPLISVSVAANFGLREPGVGVTVAVLVPGAMPCMTSLPCVLALTLREAAMHPRRFADQPVSLFLHFAPPAGAAFQPALRHILPEGCGPARLCIGVPDLAGNTYSLTAECTNLDPLLQATALDQPASDFGPAERDLCPLAAAERADLSAFYKQSRKRYLSFAAQQARLALIFGLRMKP